MAKFGSMIILEPAGPAVSGGIFHLNRPSPRDAVQVVDGRWTVEVRAGCEVVVARGGDATSYEESLLQALDMAQRGLDLLSILGIADRAVTEAENEHVAWWIEPAEVVLRIHDHYTSGFWASATGSVLDPSGKPIPPPLPNDSWHESFRYYRLSQATDDLYDAYRNLFLALESILSTIEPVKLRPNGKPGEGEGVWLRRAIRAAAERVDIKRFVPPGTTDAEQYLFGDLYEDKRTALFHAKRNRAVFLPHGAVTERDSVTASLVRLADLYLALVEDHLQMRRGRSHLSQMAFEKMAKVLNGLAVTDETEELMRDGEVASIEGRRLVPMACRRATELDEPFSKNLLGSLEVSRMGEPLVVNQVVIFFGEGIPGGFTRLKKTLTLEGIGRLEFLLRQRLKNNEPRKLYGM